MSDELIDLLKNHMEIEEKTVRALSPLADMTKNNVFRVFLRRLILDSMKHVDILRAVIDLKRGVVVSDIEKEWMWKELKTHIDNEKEMMLSVQIILSKVQDKKIKVLLEEILCDEQQHHEILNELLKILEGIEKIS